MNFEDIVGHAYGGFYLAAFILLVFVAMFLHEMGHFLAARFFGMPVESVTLGRGKILKAWDDKNGVRWAVCRWPWGAHVHLAGMGEDCTDRRAFGLHVYWKRMAVILAGPFVNLVTPFVLFPLFYIAFGQPSGPPVIAGIEIGLVADKAGLEPGDRFLAVDGQPLDNMQDIWRVAYGKGPAEARYTVARGDRVFEVTLKPGWSEYEDSGILRANARFGIGWYHTPHDLTALTSLDGVPTHDDPDLTRRLLIQALDREVVIGVKGPDDMPMMFRVRLSRALNPGLFDKNHEHYDLVFLGSEYGNFYLRRPVAASVCEGLRTGVEMIGKVASIPAQLFPIDRSMISDEYRVFRPETAGANMIYRLLYKMALISVVFGLINLLPLPGLDGGSVLISTGEALNGVQFSRKQKARIYVTVFIVLYGSIVFSNLDNFPRYIDFRLKKLQEFISQAD